MKAQSHQLAVFLVILAILTEIKRNLVSLIDARFTHAVNHKS